MNLKHVLNRYIINSLPIKRYFSLTILSGILIVTSCTTLRNDSKITRDDGKINLNYLLINDVYEIEPLAGGSAGGVARVATLKKEYLKSNPNTFLVIAGDFLSPSVYNSLQYEGKRIRGAQMVDALNSAGTDFAIFGNHEFDITEAELQDRINESSFMWISSNTFHKKGTASAPFEKSISSGSQAFPQTYIQTVTDADGTSAKIGFIGLTLTFNKASYVNYTDPLTQAETLYNRIKDSCDAVVAITHQLIEDDIVLAKKLPKLAMILGGHEHDMRFEKVDNVYIVKAHANAKSAYAMNLKIDKNKHRIKVLPELKMIDGTVSLDSTTAAVVKKWTDVAEKSYGAIGFEPKKIVLQTGEPLDGREAEIRSHPTSLSRLVVAGIQYAAPEANVVIVNAGSVRVDDILTAPVSQYDLLRSLPFGGGITEVDMKGSLLIRTLNVGRKNSGIGGFLHYSDSLKYNTAADVWTLGNTAIDPIKTYRVALPDFLLTGGEANMDFLKKDNPDILKIYPRSDNTADLKSDIRLAMVKYLETRKN